MVTTRQRIARTRDKVSEVGVVRQLEAETAAELDALLPSVLSHAFNGGL